MISGTTPACTPPGAYVTVRTLPAAQLVLLPDLPLRGLLRRRLASLRG